MRKEPGETGAQGRLRLLAYCLASGALGTAFASVASAAFPGTARLVVWVSALAAVSLAAGLAYGHGLALLRAARRRWRRRG